MIFDKPVVEHVVHDLKETYKRLFQLSYVMLFVGFAIALINVFYGTYLSGTLIAGLLLMHSIILFIGSRGYVKYLVTIIIIEINIFLVAIAFAEGHKSGGYLYFLPLMFALPIIVENHRKYTLELVYYFVFTTSCFCICTFFCDDTSPWQRISVEMYKIMFTVNSFCAVIFSSVFAYMSVQFERSYATALVAEKNKVEAAMQERTKFLSNMGHELRTPLNGIIGAANLLNQETIPPEQEQYFRILKYCSEHMLNLVNDILDFNKIEAGKIELHPVEFNLKSLMEQSALPFLNRCEEKNLEFKAEIDEELNEFVLADDIRLIQIINNLLSNALKFTEKGYIKLQATCLNKTSKQVRIKFAVEDTGIGIESNNIDRIFESFWQAYHQSTRKFGGTGLGLTISQRLLNLMNSKLQLASEFGKGSTFYFETDFEVTNKTKTDSLVKTEITNLEGYNILIAEDNVINMLIAKKMLLDWKVNLTTCINGQQAIDSFNDNPNFDLVLMDLEMPEVDGYAATAAIKKAHPNVPILAFTAALMDNEMYNYLLSVGFTDCILKPYQPMELFSKIRQCLN